MTKSGGAGGGGGRATWRSALLPAHTRARARAGAVGPRISPPLQPGEPLPLAEGRAGRGGRVSLPATPAPHVTACGTVRSGPLSPFLRSLGPAGARVPQQSDALGGARVVPPVPPTPHFKGDCAADVRRLLVHSLARELYFHNSMQRRGTRIGVSSNLTLSRPLSLCSPPRLLPPSGDSRLYNRSAPRGRESACWLPQHRGAPVSPPTREKRAAQVHAPKRGFKGKWGAHRSGRARPPDLNPAGGGSAALGGVGCKKRELPGNGLQLAVRE